MPKVIEMPNSVLLPEVGALIAEGHDVTLAPKGNSMRPFIENRRDKVVLAQPTELKIGDAVLAEIAKGVFVLHRIIKVDGEKLTLQGDGNLRGIERCLSSNVLGVVTRYVYPNRTVEASSPWLRRKITLWRRLRPVRRYLLFIYRLCLK